MKLFLFSLLATASLAAVAEVAVPQYEGFSITPPEGWVVWAGHQAPGHALWGKIDRDNIRHTTLADVRISPPGAAKITLANLQSAMEQKLKQPSPPRMKDFQFELTTGSRRGTPTLEVRTQCLDTGVTPAAKLYTYGFILITPDKRIFSAIISERSAQPNFQFNEAEAVKFLDGISW